MPGSLKSANEYELQKETDLIKLATKIKQSAIAWKFVPKFGSYNRKRSLSESMNDWICSCIQNVACTCRGRHLVYDRRHCLRSKKPLGQNYSFLVVNAYDV